MRIVVDENIPYAMDLFSMLGEVITVSGRAMNAKLIKDVDLLIVRSITKVNEELLGSSKVRFVGTSTIGIDHIDVEYLKQRGIAFSSAPGSNAESVAQYIATALAYASAVTGRALSQSSLGVIGAGHCGRRVIRIARALGMNVLVCDPPLARASGKRADYVSLEALLECDYLTLHVPLTRVGEDTTYHLFNESIIRQLKPGTVLINASRGGVVDENALIQRPDLIMVLDTWENEPSINLNVVHRALIATPHIAGYSFDGKIAGAMMIFHAACQAFDISIDIPVLELPKSHISTIELHAENYTFDALAAMLMTTAYPLLRDSMHLKFNLATPDTLTLNQKFDVLRKNYPLRREFTATNVVLHEACDTWKERFKQIGFHVS